MSSADADPPQDDIDIGHLPLVDLDRCMIRIYLLGVRTPGISRRLITATGIRPELIDAAVEQLIDQGLLREGGTVDTWEAIPPDIALPGLAALHEQRAATLRDTARDLGHVYRAARARVASDGGGGVTVLRSLEELAAAIETVDASATRELHAFYDDSPRTAHLFGMSLDAHRERRITWEGRPVKLHTTFDTGILQYPRAGDVLLARVEGGEESRFLSGVPFSTVIADETAAVVDLTSFDTSGGGSLLVHDRRVVLALRGLSASLWRIATPMAWESLGTLDRRSVLVLSLLAAGATDATIAAQSGLSQRTVERRVRSLMTQLGAATRFQAGVQAARRGWL